jgi:small subunit ribosomal protein S1
MMERQQTEQSAWGQQFAALLDGEYEYKRAARRQVRKATVIAMDDDEMIVDLGVKRDGVVPERDLRSLGDQYLGELQVGDQIPVYVLDASERRSEIVVSLKQGLAQQDWVRAEEMIESDELCEVEVRQANRGGLVVQFGRVDGFVPNSHLTSLPRGLRGERLAEAKAKLIGKTLMVAVIEAIPQRRRLVLSERVAQRQRRQQTLEELTEGESRTGIVRSIVDYGAFVDVGGLIHISEMGWQHVRHPSEVLDIGDEVEVYILKVDRDRERISLSRKRLLPDPWPIVTDALHEGEVVEGTITHLAHFGAFIDLGQGVEGLAHVSTMPHGEQTLASLTPGDPIQVRVLGVDLWRRRIALSLQGAELA